MLGLGLPELARRGHLGDHLAWPQAGVLDIDNGLEGDALLLVVEVEDGRAVAGTDVVALAVLRRRIVDLEEELQQRTVVGLRRVVAYFDGLGMARVVAIGGVIVAPAGVADPRRNHSGLLTNQVLHAPEASTGQNRLSRVGHDSASLELGSATPDRSAVLIVRSLMHPPS